MTAIPRRPARTRHSVQELAALLVLSLHAGLALAQPTEVTLPASEPTAPAPPDRPADEPDRASVEPEGEKIPEASSRPDLHPVS